MDLGELSWTCMIEYFFLFFYCCFQKRYHDTRKIKKLCPSSMTHSFLYYLGRFIGFGIGQWVYQSAPRVDSSSVWNFSISFVSLSTYARKMYAHRPVTITIMITYRQLLNLSRRPFCPRVSPDLSSPVFDELRAKYRLALLS